MKKYLPYDLMRVLACIAVIMVHTAGTGLLPGRDYPILTTEWLTCVIFSCLVGWCVPLFVMISGALFLDENKNFSIHRLYSGNILRLTIILLVWTLLYAWWTKGSIFPLGLTSGHLWYLPMTIAIYMAIPVLRAIPVRMRDYFLIIWAIWVVIDYICKLAGSNPLEIFEHYFFSGYIGYFLLGDWCRRHKDNKRFSRVMVYASTACIALIISGSILLTYINRGGQLLTDYFSPLNIVISMGVFYFCDLTCHRMPSWTTKIVTFLAPLTLGIYLVHMEILIQIYTRVQRFIPQPILLIPIVCGIAFVGGAVFTWLIKKIPYINKYIV